LRIGLIEQLDGESGSVVVYDPDMNEYSLAVGQASSIIG
jgi:hypothetical protein